MASCLQASSAPRMLATMASSLVSVLERSRLGGHVAERGSELTLPVELFVAEGGHHQRDVLPIHVERPLRVLAEAVEGVVVQVAPPEYQVDRMPVVMSYFTTVSKSPAVTPTPGYALGFSQPHSAFSKSEFQGLVSCPNRS